MDYQNGKIYTIRSPHTEKYYIGSCKQPLYKRWWSHKNRLTCTSREIIALGDAYIELMELYPCNNKMELWKREGELQRLHRADIVNFKFEARTEEEKIAHRKHYNSLEKNKERQKIYGKEHREERNALQKKYYQKNKEKIQASQKTPEAREKNNDKQKKWADKNRDKLNARRRELRKLKKEQANLVVTEKK